MNSLVRYLKTIRELGSMYINRKSMRIYVCSAVIDNATEKHRSWKGA